MVGLSVAIGRFIEALFWAILKVAGSIVGAVLGVVFVVAALWFIIQRLRRRP
ncbi:MAG TPA: hypothetical protein VF695_11340 [Sphingomonas sp.]